MTLAPRSLRTLARPEFGEGCRDSHPLLEATPAAGQSPFRGVLLTIGKGAAWVLLAGALLVGCSPAFNWRDVLIGDGGLIALLPCKPDRATREVVLAGESVAVQMVGCEAGGVMFTVAQASARDVAQASAWQVAWQAAMLTKLQAGAPGEAGFAVRGAAAVPAPLRLRATGNDAAGQRVTTQAVWWAQAGTPGRPQVRLYQAVVLGQPQDAEAAGTFFEGLRLP